MSSASEIQNDLIKHGMNKQTPDLSFHLKLPPRAGFDHKRTFSPTSGGIHDMLQPTERDIPEAIHVNRVNGKQNLASVPDSPPEVYVSPMS